MIEQLIKAFQENANLEDKIKSEGYLKNQFVCFGVKQPIRKKLQKPIIDYSKTLSKSELKKLIIELHNEGHRELMYVAQNMVETNYKKFDYQDIIWLTKLLDINGWWENVDGYNKSFFLILSNENKIKWFVEKYYQDQSIWVRRMTILIQLKTKANTDPELIKLVFDYNQFDHEFFIQKALGWILKEYGKTNSQWVNQFVNSHELSKIAHREAIKYIK